LLGLNIEELLEWTLFQCGHLLGKLLLEIKLPQNRG
jgi:hypothetical protein